MLILLRMAESIAARATRLLAFSGLYVFTDAILERERGHREIWHPLAAGTLSGLGFGLSMRRPLVGFTGGIFVGALAVPAAYSLHDVLGRPTFFQLLRRIEARERAKRAAETAVTASADGQPIAGSASAASATLGAINPSRVDVTSQPSGSCPGLGHMPPAPAVSITGSTSATDTAAVKTPAGP